MKKNHTFRGRVPVALVLTIFVIVALVICVWLEASDAAIYTLGGALAVLVPTAVGQQKTIRAEKKKAESEPPPSD